MKIRLSPVRMGEELSASVSGDVITLNGVSLDFSPLPEGGRLPEAAILNQWVLGDVERVGGEICLTLILPHGSRAPFETRFPAAYTVPMTVGDGHVPLPIYNEPEEADAPTQGQEEGAI